MARIEGRFDELLAREIAELMKLSELGNSLGKRAKDTLNSKNLTPSILETVEACKEPIFVSSLCWNMSQKDSGNYDPQEKMIFNAINEYGDVDNAVLKATPHNYRPSGFVGACLQIFRHLAQILLEIRQYSCVEFIQSAGKFADAITQQ